MISRDPLGPGLDEAGSRRFSPSTPTDAGQLDACGAKFLLP